MAAQKNIMRDFTLNEISMVDSPAQEGARFLIMKRRGANDTQKKEGKDDLNKRAALTTEVADHTHTLYLGYKMEDGHDYEYEAGETSWQNRHDHPWIRDAEGNIVIGVADGHTHEVAVMSKQNKTPDNGDQTVIKDNNLNKPRGEDATVDKIEKLRVQKLEDVISLDSPRRGYYDTLTEPSDQDYFLGLASDDQERLIKAAGDPNPVVYTSVEGIMYHKLDDPRLIVLAKKADADKKYYAEIEKRSKLVDLKKRATGYPFLPANEDIVVAMLGAFDEIEDEELRKGAHECLKARNAALEKVFDTYGHTGIEGGDVIDMENPEDTLDQLAREYAHKNNVLFSKAYDAVLNTDEGQQLYAAIA